jgi:dihydroorotate dehydrogenase
MFIAVRKEPNGLIYMDKNCYTIAQEVQDEQGNVKIKPLFSDEQLSNPPYNYTKVEIDDKYSDCQASDFNDDLTFSVEKYNVRKQQENKVNYKREIERLIALRYDVYDELAIQRQKNTKPEEYQEYFDYVEQCKQEVKEKYGY